MYMCEFCKSPNRGISSYACIWGGDWVCDSCVIFILFFWENRLDSWVHSIITFCPISLQKRSRFEILSKNTHSNTFNINIKLCLKGPSSASSLLCIHSQSLWKHPHLKNSGHYIGTMGKSCVCCGHQVGYFSSYLLETPPEFWLLPLRFLPSHVRSTEIIFWK